jgi:tight adherence protein B
MGAVVGLGLGIGLLLIWSAVERVLASAGMGQVRPGGFVVLCIVCGSVALVIAQVASRTLPVALVFGAIGGYLPVALVRGRARRRQREFADVWPEAVDNLASAVRAGMSLPEALTALSVRGPEPLRPAFTAFGVDYQVSGRFFDALDRLKDRLADPVGDRVIEGLRIAREVGGGDLGRVLRSLSGYLRDDARTRSELEARQSWTVNGARLAVSAPWLVLLLLCFQPQVIHRYATGTGVVLLVAGAAVCLACYRLMLRIGRLPTERRILS